MKRNWIVVLVWIFLSFGCSEDKPVILSENDGHRYALSEFRGKWVLINYGAHWCSYCQREVKELNAFSEKHEKEVAVFAVDYGMKMDEKALEERPFHEKPHFPILKQDPSKDLHIRPISSLPTTVIIDPQGKVYKQLQGVYTEKDLERLLQLGS